MSLYRHVPIHLRILAILLANAALLQAAKPSNAAGHWAHFYRSSKHEDCGDCLTEPSLEWVRSYARWHAEQLQTPSQAKYLLYLCGQPNWEGVSDAAKKKSFPGVCLGTGDRLRGMIEMIRLAAYSNRVLLFHWSHPLKLEDAFEPNGIDWRVKAEYNLDLDVLHAPYYSFNRDAPAELADGTWRDLHRNRRLVIIRTSAHDHNGKALYPHEPHFGWEAARAHIYRVLFKPTQVIEERAAQMQQQLLGSTNKPYVAVHLRLGGLTGERQVVTRFEQFKGLLSSLVCARALAAAANITGTPVLIVTDNILLRRLIADGYFSGVVGPPMDLLPTHLDSAHGATKDSHLSTFVDLVVLSRAKAFLASPSGFSSVATYLGHSAHVATIPACITTLSKIKPEEPVLGL